MSKKAYIKGSRLSEVLALIQVLAYDKITSRSETGLSKELQNKPSTATSWVTLANQHPEFFRVKEGEDDDGKKKDLVSLVSRFVLQKHPNSKNRPVLEANSGHDVNVSMKRPGNDILNAGPVRPEIGYQWRRLH